MKTALSVATSGERAGRSTGSASLAAGLAKRPRSSTVESIGTRPQSGSSSVVAALDRADAVHHVEALEGVLAVEEPALVDLAQVALDVDAGERGAAEQHRDLGQAAGVQLLEVLAHDQRALHEQAAHADGVGLHLDGLVDHLGDVRP